MAAEKKILDLEGQCGGSVWGSTNRMRGALARDLITIGVVVRVDGGVPVGFGMCLLEAKAAGDAVGVLLEQLADVAIDDHVPAIDDAGLDQRLPVVLAREEVLQVPVGQRLVMRALLQWRNPELPAVHLEFIIIYTMAEKEGDR